MNVKKIFNIAIMQKSILLVFCFVVMQAWGQYKNVTFPILQTPTSVSYLAFTTGYDVNSWGDQDYCLFNSISVYNGNGLIGSYSTKHGQYISFTFIGGTNESNVHGSQSFWCESKQMAFYSNWNGNKLSAFVMKDDSLYFVDLETDNILGTFPLTTIPGTSFRPPSICILVYSGRLTSTAIHRIVVNSEGSVKIYESLPKPKDEEAYEFVDLGLPSGLLWANRNVGASRPEEYGSYYSWGETMPKSNYDWNTYKYCNGSNTTLTKYCYSSDFGAVDNKFILDEEDDAATINWGKSWRLPTIDEAIELCYNSIWSKGNLNGVDGFYVKGPNGNSIFIPLAGYKEGSETIEEGFSLYLFLSTLYYDDNDEKHPDYGNFLFCDGSQYGWGGVERFCGFTVRAVKKTDSSGMTNRQFNQGNEEKIYDMHGRLLTKMGKGLNILRMRDGTTKKIIIR